MSKILQKYIKFSTKELEQYAANPDSCVLCVKTDLHLSMGPYGMSNFKHALHELLIRTKVGIYDANLNGIVLGIKNIKVLGQTAGMRADDPTLHLVINADFYVLRPKAGAVLHGVVRHISKHQISAIIYRVFNTTIRFTNKKQSRDGIVMDQEIKFRIKDFNIGNVMPYIEGELLLDESEAQSKTIKFEDDAEVAEQETPVANGNDNGAHVELDALVELIKVEPNLTPEPSPKKKKSEKRKKTLEEEVNKVVPQVKKSKKIKMEPV
ncbi:DNA-directed RNA polymerase I subunit RPA43 [Drosophila albomicans]|uniref:DNA-directed RNA polymerase I subunit RPA43 n=1 Tax=Drosophila albomicans TaxID=7291 RepID=A0A6P8WIL0_DROAB|nr:DNA-directed RNA polymerase I subunit RPA43 [Drosophila albomicans]